MTAEERYENALKEHAREITALNLKNAVMDTRMEDKGITIEQTAMSIRIGMGDDTQFLIKELQKLI